MKLPGSVVRFLSGRGEGCRGGYPDANRVHRRRVHGGGDGTGVLYKAGRDRIGHLRVAVHRPVPQRVLSEDVGANVLGSNGGAMESSDVVFLTVKPHVLSRR